MADILPENAFALSKVHQAGIGLFEIRSLYEIRILNSGIADDPAVELYDFHDYVQGVYGDSFLNAPERFLKTEWGPQMDVYALAGISYLLLTEVKASESLDRMLEDTLKRPSELGVPISRPMEAALMHALQVRKEEHMQTMDTLIRELTEEDVREYSSAREPGV